jgi:DNA-binding GntR family transcriptional regulator
MSDRFPSKARWAEIASGFADGIETGRYTPGEPLGSMEELARICVAGREAMRRALCELAATGYVVRRGRWYVSDDPPLRQTPSQGRERLTGR